MNEFFNNFLIPPRLKERTPIIVEIADGIEELLTDSNYPYFSTVYRGSDEHLVKSTYIEIDDDARVQTIEICPKESEEYNSLNQDLEEVEL